MIQVKPPFKSCPSLDSFTPASSIGHPQVRIHLVEDNIPLIRIPCQIVAHFLPFLSSRPLAQLVAPSRARYPFKVLHYNATTLIPPLLPPCITILLLPSAEQPNSRNDPRVVKSPQRLCLPWPYWNASSRPGQSWTSEHTDRGSRRSRGRPPAPMSKSPALTLIPNTTPAEYYWQTMVRFNQVAGGHTNSTKPW